MHITEFKPKVKAIAEIMTKKSDSSDKPKVPNLGIQWPLESGGRTTKVAKDIWSTVALAAMDEELSEAGTDVEQTKLAYRVECLGSHGSAIAKTC